MIPEELENALKDWASGCDADGLLLAGEALLELLADAAAWKESDEDNDYEHVVEMLWQAIRTLDL